MSISDTLILKTTKNGSKKKKKGKKTAKDDFKKNFKRALGGIKTGVDNMSRAAYFLPEKIDKVMTKLTSKMTDSIYDASDKKPATSNSKQVDAMEAKLRREFDVEEVLTRAEDIFQKIIDKLNIANNTESATTKNLLKDNFQSFKNKMSRMDISKVNGESKYKHLMIDVRSIEQKLRELYDKSNTNVFLEDFEGISRQILNTKGLDPITPTPFHKPNKFLKTYKDLTCTLTQKKITIRDEFVAFTKNFDMAISSHLSKFNTVIAEPYIKDLQIISKSLTDVFYVNPLKFESHLKKIKKFFKKLKRNDSYYVFDSEIKELEQLAEEVRFEKNAREKANNTPADNSKLEADKRNDASVLKRALYMLMAVPFLIISTYNWYYLIVYRDADLFADVPPMDGKDPRVVNDKTAIHWDFNRAGPLCDIIDHLFGSLVYPTRLLNRVLLEHESPMIPGFFENKYPLNERAGVLALFTFILYFMFFGVSFKELIKSDDKCKPKKNNIIVKLFMGLIIFYYIFRVFFIFLGGSHSEGFIASFAKGMSIHPLNFNFVPLLARPVIALILFILLIIGLFFIAMLSVNMSIMVVMMYLILHSLFGFYMYRPTTGTDSRWFYQDIPQGLSYYRSMWKILSNIFDREREEWEDLEVCKGWTLKGQFMIKVMGRIFTWLWPIIGLVAIIYSAIKLKLDEMKVFVSILIAVLAGIFMAISWNWKHLFGSKEKVGTGTNMQNNPLVSN